MNLYGFASGDPVNFTDPFGLTPFVQCRELTNPGRIFGYTHCALRVQNDKVDVLIELIPQNDKNEVFWRSAAGEGASGAGDSQYDAAGWTPVAKPAGMTDEEFDNAVLNSAYKRTEDVRGKPYSRDGSKNSNNFVYTTLKGAGAKPPAGAAKGKGSPGLCGGSGTDTGKDCTPK